MPIDADPILQHFPNSGTVVVFDLEFTAWEGSLEHQWSRNGEHREVVQFGAVLVDVAEGFRVMGYYSQLVKPAINPVLSDYFIELTGITQADVDGQGIGFASAYGRFVDFCGDASALYCNGSDGEVLRENCELLGVADELGMGRVMNIEPALVRAVSRFSGTDRESIFSCDLTGVLGLEHEHIQPGVHDALSDAVTISQALAKLRSLGLI